MRASTKTLLIAKVTDGKTPRQHIVAAFPNDGDAKAFGAAIHAADTKQDAETLIALDPAAHVTEDKTPVWGIKFALVQVPYSPAPYVATEDLFA